MSSVTLSPVDETASYTSTTRLATVAQSYSRARECPSARSRARSALSSRRSLHTDPVKPGLIGEQSTGSTLSKHPLERVDVTGQHGRAARHGLEKHDAETLATGVGRDVHVCRGERARLVLLAHQSEECDAGSDIRSEGVVKLLDVTRPGDEQPQARMPSSDLRQRIEQHRQTLARLIYATDEEQRSALAGPPRQRLCVTEQRAVDTVGDEYGVTAHVLDQRLTRGLAHRDARRHLLQGGLRDRVHGRKGTGSLHRRVPRGHNRSACSPAREDRDAGCQRLMDVQHVEVAAAQPLADPARGARPKRDLGLRAVVGHRERRACRHDVRRQRVIILARREDADVVAEALQGHREVAHVHLDPARHSPVVGADDADLHDVGALLGSRSSSHTRWSMCQSVG